MSDLISRQAAIDAIEEYADRLQMVNWKENPNVPYKVHSLNWCINTIRDLPSAQPERETAKFIRWMECKKTVNYISYTPHCKCSKCGTEFIIDTIKYCYMCGARMEGADDE